MSRKTAYKKIAGIILAVLIVALSFCIAPSEALSREGILSLAILLGAVALWLTEAFPNGVTGLTALVVMVLFGIADMGSVFSGFGGSTVIFTMAIFSLSVITVKSSIGNRIVGFALRLAKANSRRLVLTFMMAAALLSTIMSNMAVTAMFMGLCYAVFKQIGAKPGSSNLAKCLLIGIPMATMNGGMGTPAGSSNSILAMGLLEQLTGQNITFLEWTIVGLPMAIIMAPISWFFITLFLKPEPISEADLNALYKELDAGKIDTYDKKVLFFLIGLPVLWILGTWIPVLNVTVVSVLGLMLMFMPGIEILTWDEFQKGVPWTVVLMLGSVMSLGAIVGKTGGIAFITNTMLNSPVMDLGIFPLMFVFFALIYLTNSFLPIGPAMIGLFFAPLVGICTGAGLSAAIPGMIMSFTLSGSYLLPLNPNNLITYDGGYYTPMDVFKTGLIPSFFLVLFSVLWVPFMTSALHIVTSVTLPLA